MNEIDIKTFIEIEGVEYCISTTWLSKTIPLYETMVFEAMDRKIFNYNEVSEYTKQYRNKEAAIKGHYETLRKMLLNSWHWSPPMLYLTYKLRGGKIMIGYMILFIIWSLLMVCLGINFNSKLDESYIETLEKSRDFHKDQKEMFVEHSKRIFKEYKHLKESNTQLINENKKLKKELDKQDNVTYNYYINK